ncbi:MAG: Trk system potassium transporter TrkA [Desulfobacula sp.]|jgi:trk system potassium uptake protein TrkA|uniref:Trk system potassium transporter TrkA n=1 Tax=Desulfobacula sp. TaxID=2593537 RepID=UPI001DA49F02|nr:Trk system potassium transporter TrkA [Desulfobacula sp.]MBT3487813.1 Trk system potassium transporter TrkA [Desulfobacula sp.]MBT3805513.1 Trk system potassium transporter TrkA [Desulfobacula sp.]MBT4025909.1 Trk system potassium transporter TrkA [Desulfobacula sp.]MBT4199137.1 Trk system potassium transporter TrkA [Desulfobacula sp.]
MKANKPAKSTNILILGLGGVGYYLAKRLVHEGYAITAIEQDSKLLRHADGNIDARLIQGNAMSIGCWREADAAKMDYLISVTNNDAVNMMSCLIGDRFGIPRKIARIRSTEFGSKDSFLSADDLKIDLIIHPEELVAQEIFRLVKLRAGNDIIAVAKGQIQAMGTRIHEGSPLAYRKLKDISQEYNDFPFRIVAIARGITTLIPSGEDELLPQDQAFFMASNKNLDLLMSLTGVEQQSRHRVMIIGGGLVGCRLAELLDKTVEVRLIEKDEPVAKELSFALKNSEVLHGDGSDSDVLISAGLLEMDTFITATGENETNIMSCVLAKHLMTSQNTKNNGKKKTIQSKCIALVNKEDYMVLAATMGSDLALNKKILAGNKILKFIRRGELLSVSHLHGFDAEMVEIVAAPNSPITRKPLSKLGSHYNGKIMVGGIHRDGVWQVAVGDTHIQNNERAIVVCMSQHLKDVQKLFLA